MKNKKHIISIIIIIILIAIITNPLENINAFSKGINVWATKVLPALFPFFLFSKLLCEFDSISSFCKIFSPITKKLFNCDGISSYIYFISIISGYPVGAKVVSDLYNKGAISKGQAHRIITFTSTSGPLFIMGTVGVGMFLSKRLGFIVLISHYLSAILNGIIFRKYMLSQNITKIKTFKNEINKSILEDSMINSIKSILIVGGYISIFFLLINMINKFNIFKPILFLFKNIKIEKFSEIFTSILNGLIEVTKGCFDLSLLQLNENIAIVLITALITFGGFSIHAQANTFLKTCEISYKFFITQKITHTIISILIACVMILIF